jgi:hypothetical protein
MRFSDAPQRCGGAPLVKPLAREGKPEKLMDGSRLFIGTGAAAAALAARRRSPALAGFRADFAQPSLRGGNTGVIASGPHMSPLVAKISLPEEAALRRLDAAIWSLIGITAVLVGAATAGPFRLQWTSFSGPAIGTLVLLAGSTYYTRWRNEPALASALGATAQLVAFAAVAAPLSYVAASLDRPLLDSAFARLDGAAGLDWMAMLAWMNAHPALHAVFAFAYASFALQATLAIMGLAYFRQLLRLRTFLLAFFICTLGTIAVSALAPAEGTWTTYGVTAADHPAIVPAVRDLPMAHFHALRDGSLRTLMAAGAEGIITFPSLHAALGAIFLLALWRLPVIGFMALGLNIAMIAATPVEGSHYFVDVLAGLAMALASWGVARSVTRGRARPRPAAVSSVAPPPQASAALGD